MIGIGRSPCDDIDELLPLFYDGDLEAAERRRVTSHLDGCPACQAALVNLGAAMGALHALPMPELGDLSDRVRQAAAQLGSLPSAIPRWRWRSASVVAVAASITLAATAFLGIWYGQRSVPPVGQQLREGGLVATNEGWLTATALRERASGRIWLAGRWTDPKVGAGRILSADGMVARDDMWLGRAAADRLDGGQVLQADGWIAPDRFIAERLQAQGLKKTGDSWIGAPDVAGLRRDGAPVAEERIVAEQLTGQGYIREASGGWRLASEAERLADEAAHLARGEVRLGTGWTTPEAIADAKMAAAGFVRDAAGMWHAPAPPPPVAAQTPATALPTGWRALASVPATTRVAETPDGARRALAAIRPGAGGGVSSLASQPRPLPIGKDSGLAGGWIVRLPVGVVGTPAVVAGRVHVSTGGGGGNRVLAVHALTGQGLWSNMLSDDTPSNPVGYEDEDVAYTTGSCTLYAIAGKTGRVSMNAWISGHLSAMPTVSAGLLLTTSPEGGVWTVTALDGQSGKRAWAASMPSEVRTGLLSAGGRIVAATQDGTLIAWQSQTGKELWRRRLALASPPAFSGDEILVRRLLCRSSGDLGETTAILDGGDGGMRTESLGEPRLLPGLRIDAPTGSSEDEISSLVLVAPAPVEGGAAPAVPALGPVVVAGRTTVVLTDNALEARSLVDGQVRWRHNLTKGVALTDTHTDPVIAGDLVIIGCLDGWVRAFDLGTGNPRWSVQVGSPLGGGGPQMLRRQPVVAAGRVYLTTRSGELVCVDTGDRGLQGPRWWGDRG